jgi:hypothetical protein
MSNIRPVPYETAVAVFGEWLAQVDAIDRATHPDAHGYRLAKPEWAAQPVRYWTRSEDETCLRMWGEGATIAQIATAVRRSVNATTRRLDDLRWELAGRGR